MKITVQDVPAEYPEFVFHGRAITKEDIAQYQDPRDVGFGQENWNMMAPGGERRDW